MIPKNGYKDVSISTALERALGMLGESSKQSLMYYMTRQYGISFDGAKGCSIEEVEFALKSILGSGSRIITERLDAELARLPQ